MVFLIPWSVEYSYCSEFALLLWIPSCFWVYTILKLWYRATLTGILLCFSYQKAWREYVKHRHLVANLAKPSTEDKQKLAAKEADLQKMRTKSNMKRDVTVCNTSCLVSALSFVVSIILLILLAVVGDIATNSDIQAAIVVWVGDSNLVESAPMDSESFFILLADAAMLICLLRVYMGHEVRKGDNISKHFNLIIS